VPDVERAVGIGQSGSDEKFAGHLNSLPCWPQLSQPALFRAQRAYP
jgi:hypothetical protein